MPKAAVRMKKFSECPLCGGSIIKRYSGLRDRLDTTKKQFTIWECTKCGLGFLNPMPVGDASQFYPTNYLSGETESDDSAGKMDVERWYRYNQYRYDFDLLKSASGTTLKDVESYVDIGCGSGERVAFAEQQGCLSAFGVDKFDFAKNATKKETRIINSEIMDFKPKSKFEVASLFHVLEHLEDPHSALRHIGKHILKKDGYIILQVPNYQALERYIFKNRWFSFDVPRHLWQFNERALADVLSKEGFEIKAIFKTNAPLHPVTVVPSINRELDIQRIWVKRSRGNFYVKFMTLLWVGVTALTIPFTIFQNLLNRSSMLTVIARNDKSR